MALASALAPALAATLASAPAATTTATARVAATGPGPTPAAGTRPCVTATTNTIVTFCLASHGPFGYVHIQDIISLKTSIFVHTTRAHTMNIL